ncbi:MAG: hypothetical protein K0R67_3759 [Paenibacillus sp.]|nr:hypothetical protein [Paenibacillus sp.]
MNEIVQIGPLVLNKGLLVIIISVVCGWGAIRWSLRYFGEQAASLLELWMNAALIVLLFYKLGYLLTTPSLLWERPMTLLLMNGASREVGMGIVAAAIYLTYRLKRGGYDVRLLLDMFAWGGTASLAAYSAMLWRYGRPTELVWGIQDGFALTSYHPLNAYMLLLMFGIGYRLWRKVRAGEAGHGTVFQVAAVGAGIGGLVFSLLDEPGDSLFLFLSMQQLLFLGLALVGVIFPAITHNRDIGKERTAMKQSNENKGDSLEQREHERENEKGEPSKIVDKKLDGPNQPST